ncbi:MULTISPECIES: hypothetical protein [Chryseobacterium]|uniref:Lipoprotein n=1 Tax=Chryseobacterium bernardetii TaxID=1241978 RepID=A0A3G6T5T9_9FLAO|nr:MULTISPECIES: hypothetical protein [Chryseobacterium]AZB23269.1 hypothetical protein EG339_00870 [Chryseobacterium bernardetii]UCA62083.1 hypothetical protein KB553_11320 [Chryseobacterium rhizoplanae]
MKKFFLHTPAIVLCTTLMLVSCNSTKNLDTNLPIDIANRPADEDSQKYDQAQLDKLKASIESETKGEECTNGDSWTFAPMGIKSCGGPQQYIAYPKKIEASILPRINEYTDKVRIFNEKYNIMSDCMVIPPPAYVKCIKGEARLITPDSK